MASRRRKGRTRQPDAGEATVMRGCGQSRSRRRDFFGTRRRVHTHKHSLSPNSYHVQVHSLSLLSRRARCHYSRIEFAMKVKIKKWHAIAQWRWDTGNPDPDDDGEGDVCGICRVPFEGCCPSCKMPGDDCPLSKCSSSLSLSMATLPIADLPCVFSLGRVYSRLPYALLTPVDWDILVQAAMSNGPSTMG